MNLESLITDLAFILLLGAVVTLLFKWIKQPVVLGYIVAGFLASPHFTYLPSVTNEANIDFWAQIGIIVLLFALGLEFSFKKLINSGGSAVVTALIIVCGMMLAGFAIGHLLHFNNINSLFLGGMLSMSSTTIIIKAFTDMGLMQHKFAPLVMAVLIVEDLFAVVMMVVLSSIAINNSVEGGEMLYSIAKLIFFLVIWFMVGVLVLPSALNRCRRYLNGETLLVVSMGLCLGMSVFSVYCGFSLALGAFVMGSILAGTSYAERIERVVTPVKDLFGSVFFISVGMMVQPEIIVSYWFPILILSLVVIFGMITFGTFGMLVTGQTLKVAIQSGFSLTQIGEFAFIIATLGMSLGVLDSTIYPIVVAVSVITTFTTPYFIKMSVPAYNLIERHLPANLHFLINRYQEEASKENATGRSWSIVLRRYLWRSTVYVIILLAIVIIGHRYILPWLDTVGGKWSSELCTIITLGAMSPFLVAMMTPLSGAYTVDRNVHVQINNNIPRVVMSIFRFIVALAFIAYVIGWAYSARAAAGVIAMAFVIIVLLFSGKLKTRLRQMETKFFDNLNERELRRSGKNTSLVNDLHQAYMTVGSGCQYVGQRLRDSNIRKLFGVNVVSIQRDQKTIPIPGGEQRIFPGDVIGIIGSDEQISAMLPLIEVDAEPQQQARVEDVQLVNILLDEDSPLVNKTPRSSSLRDRYKALVLAVSRGDEFIDSNADIVFAPGDIVWLVADTSKISELKGKNK